MKNRLRVLLNLSFLFIVASVLSVLAWIVQVWIAAALPGTQSALVASGWWSLVSAFVFALFALVFGMLWSQLTEKLKEKQDA